MPQNSQTQGGRFSICAMPHFTGNHSVCSNRHEQSFSQTTSKNLRLSLESSSERCLETQPLGLQLQDYRQPLSTLSSNQSLHELTAIENKIPRGLCLSSNSVQNGYYQKHVKEPTESDFIGNNLELSVKPLQWSQSTVQVTDALSQPSFFNVLLNAYGPQALVHAQMAGMTVPSRIPLPCDVSQDTPVYVNVKQYFGILRRRRMRAKLQAQNKLMKSRKPYLHESRHRHAVNRVRTSGGQFLSTKKQQSKSTATSGSLVASAHSNQDREMLLQFHQDRDLLEIGIGYPPNGNGYNVSTVTNSSHTGHPNYHLTFHQEDMKIPIESGLMSAPTIDTRGMMFNGTRNCTLGFL